MVIAAFIAVQIVSLSITLLFIQQYKQISLKHIRLLHSIDDSKYPHCKIHSSVIVWIYTIVMITLTIGMSVLFYSFPNLDL